MINKQKLIKDLEKKEWNSDYARNMGCNSTFRCILNEIINDLKSGKYDEYEFHDVDEFYEK